MATWDGARALGLAGAEGLVPGAPADFVILDPEAGWSLPDEWAEEPYGAIVYSMGRDNVCRSPSWTASCATAPRTRRRRPEAARRRGPQSRREPQSPDVAGRARGSVVRRFSLESPR